MEKKYNNIYIIDSKNIFDGISLKYDVKNDLFLTYDFALKKYIKDLGGSSEYIDHIVDQETMEKNNYIAYDFFKKWHYDKDGNDIFTFKNIPFGFSFRLEFWNQYISYIRLYLSVNFISKVNYDNLFLATNDNKLLIIIEKLNLKYINLIDNSKVNSIGFYFPIQEWLDSKLKPSGLRGFLYKAREKVSYVYGKMMPFYDSLYSNFKSNIFIQDYHPTRKIIQHFRNDSSIKVVLENFSRFSSSKKENLKERLLPIGGNKNDYIDISNILLDKLEKDKCQKLIIDELDISDEIYDLIKSNIKDVISNKLRTLDGCIKYLDKNKIDLVILIANMGHTVTLFDLVCKYKKIPSYLVINGILGKNYQDEGKYAAYINSYSSSIKMNYFRNMDNIVTLGDPRMDMYAYLNQKKINRDNPTVTIGTSGFNPTDLNSYVAVEFDFMYDILQAFSILKVNGEKFSIVIKVRPNGYLEQYKDFAKEYFKDLEIEFLSTTPMIEVLKKTDFYISIYSQTLFEASCLGIPVVYYKKDTEITNAPFDNNSELVTVDSVGDMIQAFVDFKEQHPRYNDFLDKNIMEKYIGYLDGQNFERNKNYILELLKGVK